MRYLFMAYIVGITGGAGSGKSVFANALHKKGVILLDADQIARKIIDHSENIQNQIRQIFGDGIFDDHCQLNRRALARIIFKNKQMRLALNDIVWPSLVLSIKTQIQTLSGTYSKKIIVVDAAILFEANMDSFFDEIILILASFERRRERLKNRQWTLSDIDACIQAQPSYDPYISICTVVHNDDSLENLQSLANQFYKRWKMKIN